MVQRAGRGQSPSLLPLVTFLGLCVLAMCATPFDWPTCRSTWNWSSAQQTGRGVVISVQSVGMLVFIPTMGVLADRFGAHRLVVANVLLGIGANLGFMAADSEWALIAFDRPQPRPRRRRPRCTGTTKAEYLIMSRIGMTPPTTPRHRAAGGASAHRLRKLERGLGTRR